MKNRREFLKECTMGAGIAAVSGLPPVVCGAENEEVGKPLAQWKSGTMDLHFIYTGVGENMFYIFPDGTTMLLDSSDRPSKIEEEIPIKPDKSRLPSEWIARYIQRVSPSPKSIDYMMLSHYHEDHAGSDRLAECKTTGRDPDYFLSGLARLGEKFKFDTVIDRGWPRYERPVPGKINSDGFSNFYNFTQWKLKKGEIAMGEFKVGALDQIVLKKNRSAWSDFHVRNICGNGIVWSGEEGKNIDFCTLYPQKNVSENALSLGMTISWGPFRYFTGGDVSGTFRDSNKKDVEFEGAVGKAAGPVHVCKTNHHSFRDAMRPEFVKEVRASFYITNVWNSSHLQDNTMTAMADETLYPGSRTVCPTWASKKVLEQYKDRPWQSSLQPAYGHVVVRVFDGGRKYKVIFLTVEDESMTVKKVFGPYEVAALK